RAGRPVRPQRLRVLVDAALGAERAGRQQVHREQHPQGQDHRPGVFADRPDSHKAYSVRTGSSTRNRAVDSSDSSMMRMPYAAARCGSWNWVYALFALVASTERLDPARAITVAN